MSSIAQLGRQLEELRRSIEENSNAPQLGYSSIEDGTLAEYDANGSLKQVIGKQSDGTHTTTQVNGPVPPTPTNPPTTDGTESFTAGWLGDFTNALAAPLDFLRVDVHAGTTVGFTPTPATRVGEITAPLGGFVSVVVPAGTYYVKLVTVSQSGVSSPPSEAVEVDSWPVVVSSDGFAPASSPAVQAIGGFDIIHARWTPIVNADPVTYDVHISTVSGFTPDSTTLVGSTQSSAFTIKQLPGVAPAPGAPDLRKFQYFTDYYVKLVARDDDGSAAAGSQGTDQIYQMTGVNLSADSVTAAHVAVGTLTGDLFSASFILSSEIWTATTGQRVGMTPLGFFAYKSDGSIMLKIPTDGTDALYDGELVVRGATILGGMSIQSSQNELTADAALTLMRGIVSPTAVPQIADYYDTLTPSTASLSDVQKTNSDPTWGLGGPFDFIASEVSCIEWRPNLGVGCWSMFQVRPNGTREWYFTAAGAPYAPLGAYFSDFKNWEVWSATEIIGSSTPSQNGHHLMFRYMPGGAQYYVSAPSGIYSYSRQNGVAPPTLTNNGQALIVAEVINTNQLNMRSFVPTAGSGAMPAPVTAWTSDRGYAAGAALSALVYHPTGFDLATGARFLSAERGNSTNNQVIFQSGTNANALHPHGTTAPTNTWTQTTKDAGSFESPTTNRRGIGWDGTQFWTLSADGKMYKHTSDQWDPTVTSSTLWAQLSFRDQKAAGTGTHETTPGTAKAFTHKRRSKFQWVAPAVPDNGGVDDPDRVVLYAARGVIPGNTKPANSGMWKQTESLAYVTNTYTTLATSGSNPLTINSFPSSNPALIRNDNDELQIKGDGTIKGKQIFVGADEVLPNGPYWRGWVSTQAAVATNTITTLTTFTADTAPNSSGITVATGIFTVPRAGVYSLKAKLYWPLIASPAGSRLLQVVSVSPSVVLDSHTMPASAASDVVNMIDKEVRLAAGQQVFFRFRHTQGVSHGPTVTTLDLSWVQLKYVAP